jgi:hypothetical protein
MMSWASEAQLQAIIAAFQDTHPPSPFHAQTTTNYIVVYNR